MLQVFRTLDLLQPDSGTLQALAYAETLGLVGIDRVVEELLQTGGMTLPQRDITLLLDLQPVNMARKSG